MTGNKARRNLNRTLYRNGKTVYKGEGYVKMVRPCKSSGKNLHRFKYLSTNPFILSGATFADNAPRPKKLHDI